MKCTSCNNGSLIPSFIDDLFRAHTCQNCGGNWILIEDYVSWKDRNPEHQFSSDITEVIDEPTGAMLCPVSGSIMRKFRISAETSHSLDYSSAVGGVWLDKGEWELLKEEKLAGSLNNILTTNWQNTIRAESAKNNFSEIYQSKFGVEQYQEIRKIREWLNSQSNKADLRAYILAEDPYSAER
ncbi:zf-TFIIB domain-containing protein [Endozoicomonas sp. G2_1]|uniref:zf-TFIIB domain-containing protein n=1 Tax=Endozoicomonas sp. G2_1 TaxID=2821091 RepID=UPI001ADC88D5|nr:zf-TFIIB domain-containing protein [Endozoicomonas sp. G2_1]MBO9490680.1 zf-TFIIB domain-containing protein [Endozoicomonas sp. G2_1]